MVEFVQSAAYKLDVASFPTFMAINSGPPGHHLLPNTISYYEIAV